MLRRKRRAQLRISDVPSLARHLNATAIAGGVPLLVVRVRDLERIAWREGRAAARALERSSLRRFEATAAHTLRANDLLAHDDESENFVAALVSPTRTAGSVATPTDCRATLARLASAMEMESGIRVDTGWTVLAGACEDARLSNAIERALDRGARERERYAFFSTLGHELRTPLTSVRGYIETLLDGDLDRVTTRRFLEVARDEATRMGRLVDGMFEVAMFDLRDGAQRVESSLLNSSVTAAINALGRTAAARGTTLCGLQCEPCYVAIGADRLTQVLINLLENAIKHGRSGGRVHISSGALDGRYVEVRVDDDGPSVAESEREAIFALAQRGTDARAQGSGLGLAVVRLLVERIGGEVDVTGSPLGGARFRVRLPQAEFRASS